MGVRNADQLSEDSCEQKQAGRRRAAQWLQCFLCALRGVVIRQSLSRALANQARTIRLPVHIELLLGRFSKKKAELTQLLGRVPTTEEIAKALDHPLEEIEHIERMSQRPVSLDAPPVPGGAGSVEDAVADSAPPPGAGLAAALRAREDLAEVLRDLPDSERNVLGWRFGLTGEEPMTLEAIGRKLGVTRERVRQIESAALARLRRLMAVRGMEAQDLF